MTVDVVSEAGRGTTAEPVAPDPGGRAWSPEVIDLRGLDALAAPKTQAPAVKVRVERHVSPLDTMSEQQKMRLYIRVLCELVAYGEPDSEDDGPEPEPSLIA